MSALTKILQTKLIPWSTQNAREQFIVTRTNMRQKDMPRDVQLLSRKIKGKRVAVRNRRIYKNSRHVMAVWPESNLLEVQKYKLMCVLEGAIDYPVGKYSLRCGPAHFIFFPPGLPHSDGLVSHVDTSKSTFCQSLFFLLHSNAIQYWISRREQDDTQYTENALVVNQRLVLLFHTLMEELYESAESSRLAQEALLSAFFYLLQCEIHSGRIVYVYDKNPDPETTNDLPEVDSSDFRAGLERYIKMNIGNPITIEKAARAMYLSRAQFTRTVRRETGMSFNELLSAYRIEEAKVLLHDSQWTIAFIAESLGFTSDNYFRTFFREHTGKTPTKFRSRS
jgi:AraC-like DNA-binding protein